MNNRKTTSGRKVWHKPIVNVLGFTVKAKFKQNVSYDPSFRSFIPVAKRKKGENSSEWVSSEIIKAEKAANKIANNMPFECIVIPRIQNTSKRILVS